MDHAHDDDRVVGDPVVNRVTLMEMDAQPRRKSVPLRPDFRGVTQGLEPLFDLLDEPRGGLGRVLSDIGSNNRQVVFGGFGYSEVERLCDFFRPFRMILSASKAPTRSAAIS